MSGQTDDLVLYRIPQFPRPKKRFVFRISLLFAVLLGAFGKLGPGDELSGFSLILADFLLCAPFNALRSLLKQMVIQFFERECRTRELGGEACKTCERLH